MQADHSKFVTTPKFSNICISVRTLLFLTVVNNQNTIGDIGCNLYNRATFEIVSVNTKIYNSFLVL